MIRRPPRSTRTDTTLSLHDALPILTSRCDRALDRASQLASEWDAELVAAHVVDPAHTPQFHVDRSRRRWRRIHDPLQRMRWRIRRDLAGALENMRFIPQEGEPAQELSSEARSGGKGWVRTCRS